MTYPFSLGTYDSIISFENGDFSGVGGNFRPIERFIVLTKFEITSPGEFCDDER